VSGVAWHTLFELLAYLVGFQVFLAQRRREPHPALDHAEHRLVIVLGAALGAAIGSRLAYWLADPAAAFANFPDPVALVQGKSIIGGLLGGVAGVEMAKVVVGTTRSTGNAFVLPLAAGMIVGRIGCQLGGVSDHTAGNATALPWGHDFGDGVPRHATAAYEILALLLIAFLLTRDGVRRHLGTHRFDAFMALYLGFRFGIEFLKPVPHRYWPGWSGLQWLALAGLAYHGARTWRALRAWGGVRQGAVDGT